MAAGDIINKVVIPSNTEGLFNVESGDYNGVNNTSPITAGVEALKKPGNSIIESIANIFKGNKISLIDNWKIIAFVVILLVLTKKRG